MVCVCADCGESFRDKSALHAHQKRTRMKCVVRGLTADQLAEPLRCQWCGNIFKAIGGRNKHVAACKMRAGDRRVATVDNLVIVPIGAPADDRDARILELEKIIADMAAKMDDRFAAIEARAPVVVNVIINNYNTPNVDNLTLTESDILEDDVATTLLKRIYFNPDRPENHSIYAPNMKRNILKIQCDGQSRTIVDGDLKPFFMDITDKLCIVGTLIIEKMIPDHVFMTMCPVARDNIIKFTTCVGECMNHDKIMTTARQNSDMIKNSRSNAILAR